MHYETKLKMIVLIKEKVLTDQSFQPLSIKLNKISEMKESSIEREFLRCFGSNFKDRDSSTEHDKILAISPSWSGWVLIEMFKLST
jgi:hypothetical protein